MGKYCFCSLVYHKGEYSIHMKERNVSYALFIGFLLLMTLLISIPPARAQFILAEWDFDDGYGQGIHNVTIQENSTGSWVDLHTYEYGNTSLFEANYTADTAIKIIPYVTLNHTRQDLSDNTTAYAIMRLDIVVGIAGNSSYFSQQNLTWSSDVSDATASTWAFSCYVVLPFLISAGAIYTITLTYEIYEVIDL